MPGKRQEGLTPPPMGRVVFDMSVSLDGRVASPDGSLDWVAVDDETHRLFNDEARAKSAFLLGRRMYELLEAFWPTADADPSATPVIVEFARIWREKRKFVFSRTIESADPMVRVVREVTRDSVERVKQEAGGDVSVGGPTLAASLMRLGLVDDFLMYLNPVVVGGGPTYFPPVEAALSLTLTDVKTLTSGVVRLAYSLTSRRATPQAASAPSP
jgi:dihydrofolate reductase